MAAFRKSPPAPKAVADVSAGRSDQQLERRVRRWLDDDPQTRAFAARATVKNGIVTLLGEAWDRKTSQAAVQAVIHLPGIVGVRNLIVIKSDADLEIAEKLRHAISEDASVEGATIAVAVIKGTVFLSGTARTAEERARANEIAVTLPGVRSVSNGLEVSGSSVRQPAGSSVAARSYPGYRLPYR